MSNFKQYFNLKTMEERQAFLGGLSPRERVQLQNESLSDFIWIVYKSTVEAIERFIEVCKNSGIDLT